MITSNQIAAGMTIAIQSKIYRVESAVKVTVAKGAAFIKAKLRNLATDEITEKNFKPGQEIEDVCLEERCLEYLYAEGKDYLFLDVGNLERVLVPGTIIGDLVQYLKEGTDLTAIFYGDAIFSAKLPQFLELMVVKTEPYEGKAAASGSSKVAFLETGAKVDVPLFIEPGDIVKVDTQTHAYIQRV